jgi:MerR family transcriptional regulator, copper efflux regulator
MEKKYITIKEASIMIGVTPLTLRNWDNNGKFPAGRHPMSNYRVYDLADVQELIHSIEEGKVKKTQKKPSKKEPRKLIVKHE